MRLRGAQYSRRKKVAHPPSGHAAKTRTRHGFVRPPEPVAAKASVANDGGAIHSNPKISHTPEFRIRVGSTS